MTPFRHFTSDGRTQTYAEWADELGYSYCHVANWVRTRGRLPSPKVTIQSVAREGSWEQDAEARRLVAERGPLTLQEIADHMGVTRERVRQIEVVAMRKIKQIDPWLAKRLEEVDSERAERLARGATGRLA